MYQANCYVVSKSNKAIVIDPGSRGTSVMNYIRENNLEVEGILLTHGHWDHIGGVDAFVKAYHVPVYIDSCDEGMLKDTNLNCAPYKDVMIQANVNHYKIGFNEVGSFKFEAIYAPGHSEGSTMLLFDELLFSGDVLFYMSIGRCDLPTGSNSKMQNTLNKIKRMDPSLKVYPGHGEMTTLQFELMHNPYL